MAESNTQDGEVASGAQAAAVDFAAVAARLRARLRRGTDSAELVREGRDGRA